MNRKIALSGFSILSAVVLLTGSAFAAFSTSATTTSNTFSTTNPNLTVSTNGSNYSTSEVGFTQGGIVPGGSGVPHTFYLFNGNTGPDDVMTLTGQFTPVSGDLPPADLVVNITCDNGANMTKTVADWNSSPWGLSTLAPNTAATCTMTATLPSGNPSDAGKTIQFNAVFSASQGS